MRVKQSTESISFYVCFMACLEIDWSFIFTIESSSAQYILCNTHRTRDFSPYDSNHLFSDDWHSPQYLYHMICVDNWNWQLVPFWWLCYKSSHLITFEYFYVYFHHPIFRFFIAILVEAGLEKRTLFMLFISRTRHNPFTTSLLTRYKPS